MYTCMLVYLYEMYVYVCVNVYVPVHKYLHMCMGRYMYYVHVHDRFSVMLIPRNLKLFTCSTSAPLM